MSEERKDLLSPQDRKKSILKKKTTKISEEDSVSSQPLLKQVDMSLAEGSSRGVTFTSDVKHVKGVRTSSNIDDVSNPGQTSDGGTSYAVQVWKPKSETTYETLTLVKTQFNCKIRGAGFRKNGKMRHIKKTCLLAKIKTRCRIRKRNPALAVCITMYNEDSSELKNTLRGLIHNYNCFRADPNFDLTKDDFLIFVVCDGYDRIPDDFKNLAREKGFLDE